MSNNISTNILFPVPRFKSHPQVLRQRFRYRKTNYWKMKSKRQNENPMLT